ncbi:unnamed protein product [Agarophyton chilense]
MEELLLLAASNKAKAQEAATRASPAPPPPSCRSSSSPTSTICSGSATFDARARLESRTVVQMSAASRGGKTMMCVRLAATVLRGGGSVVWVDSGAGVWQVSAVVGRLASVARLSVVCVSSACDALRELERLVRHLQLHALDVAAPKPRLLVFDSPAALLAPVLGLRASSAYSGHTVMHQIAAAVNRFVLLSDATALLTNRVVGVATRPALGNAWSAFVDVHLLLQRLHSDHNGLHIRVVATSKRAPTCNFSLLITDTAIADAPL